MACSGVVMWTLARQITRSRLHQPKTRSSREHCGIRWSKELNSDSRPLLVSDSGTTFSRLQVPTWDSRLCLNRGTERVRGRAVPATFSRFRKPLIIKTNWRRPLWCLWFKLIGNLLPGKRQLPYPLQTWTLTLLSSWRQKSLEIFLCNQVDSARSDSSSPKRSPLFKFGALRKHSLVK